MKLTTTILDGMDLRIEPTNFRADPIKRNAAGKGMTGTVHFLWPVASNSRRITLYYENLDKEQTRRLLALFGPATAHNKVLQLSHNGDSWFIPGHVETRLTLKPLGRIDLTIETSARKFSETT